MPPIPHYEQHAEHLVTQYESLTFEEVHPALLGLLPPTGATVLDIGAGSGRDAAWFATHGYDVVAVEPSDAMRVLARQRHPSPRIHWLADSLPDLVQVRRLGLTFDLILLSAVWMHVPRDSRQRALRKLATLLSPNGRIAISLRIGPPDTGRAMFEVTLPELAGIAQQFGLRLVHTHDSPDRLGRAEISWTTAVLGQPDDGLGALPLLRHLVLSDTKSSTYKIALLRILARIADTAAGAARHEAEYVAVPKGLVALFWLRMVKPLIEGGLPQMPANRDGKGPGFVTNHFTALRLVRPVDLRAGMVFNDDTARHLQNPHVHTDDSANRRSIPVELWRVPGATSDLGRAEPLQRLGRASAGSGMGAADGILRRAARPRYPPACKLAAGLGRSRARYPPGARCRRTPARQWWRNPLRMVWAAASKKLRHRPLLPLRRMAMWRRVEPDASITGNQ